MDPKEVSTRDEVFHKLIKKWADFYEYHVSEVHHRLIKKMGRLFMDTMLAEPIID